MSTAQKFGNSVQISILFDFIVSFITGTCLFDICCYRLAFVWDIFPRRRRYLDAGVRK